MIISDKFVIYHFVCFKFLYFFLTARLLIMFTGEINPLLPEFSEISFLIKFMQRSAFLNFFCVSQLIGWSLG